MELHIKWNLSNKVTTLSDLVDGTTINDVKLLIHDKESIPCDQQILWCRARKLFPRHDDHTLLEINRAFPGAGPLGEAFTLYIRDPEDLEEEEEAEIGASVTAAAPSAAAASSCSSSACSSYPSSAASSSSSSSSAPAGAPAEDDGDDDDDVSDDGGDTDDYEYEDDEEGSYDQYDDGIERIIRSADDVKRALEEMKARETAEANNEEMACTYAKEEKKVRRQQGCSECGEIHNNPNNPIIECSGYTMRKTGHILGKKKRRVNCNNRCHFICTPEFKEDNADALRGMGRLPKKIDELIPDQREWKCVSCK